MTMTEFCNNNKFLPMRLSVFKYTNSGDHPSYGSVVTTTRDIEMLPDGPEGKLYLNNSKGKKTKQYITFN